MNRCLRACVILLILTGVFQPLAAQDGAASLPAIPNADMALMIGDYDTAAAEYTSATSDPALRCAALYGLAVTYARAVQYENADSTWSQYLGECENSSRALIQRGEIRRALGRSGEALADYQQALALNAGLLDSYLYQRMAGLDPDSSVRSLRLATEADRHPEGRFALRRRLAEVYLLVGSPGSALAQYDLLLQSIDEYLATLSAVEGAEYDKSGELRASIESAAADIELQQGQVEAGYARLQRVITNYWETSAALPALIDLVNAGQPVDLLARMRINVRNENFRPVVGVLTDYLNDPANASAPPELHVLLGRAQRGVGDTAAALATFERARQQFAADPAASLAALEQAETYAAMGDSAQAVTAFTAAASSYPQSPEAPIALLRAAQMERDAGNVTGALTLYSDLAARYAGTEQAEQGLNEAASLALQVEPARAAEFFGAAGSAEGFVFQGKLLQQAGDTAGARAAWERATAAEPGTFFAMRGCELLNDRQPFTPSTTLQTQPITAEDISAAEQWVAQRFGLSGVSAQLSPELAANPILRRGVELWAVGLWDEARAEFDALHKLVRNDPAALLQLAVYYQTIPVYRSSVYAATRLAFMSEMPFTQVPRAVLQLAYPVYYIDLIASVAAGYELDPLLVTALIRQETSFDATAISFAGAQGLMQFMPATAQDVANRLGQADYRITDLNRPVVSVMFGAYYLDSMRDFQDGSIAGALLSYNAGPGAALQWLNAAGGDLERLYQIVGFAETQLYLEIIYENYAVYQHLYGGGVPACMLEGAPAETSGAA